MKANAKSRLLVLADTRVAKLFEIAPTPGGSARMTLLEEAHNQHEGEHERGRASILDGSTRLHRGRGAPDATPPHFADFGHTAEEEDKRFAREVRQWLARKRAEHGDLSVLASSRLFGMLRQDTPEGVRLEEGEFAQMPVKELSSHRRILNELE